MRPGFPTGDPGPVSPRVQAALMALVAFLVLNLSSAQRGLWNPDEPREAEIAREMWADGHRVVPHLNGEPFLEKPPLYAWMAGLAFTARGGADPVGARWPSAAAGALAVALTVLLAAPLTGHRRAWMAGLVLLEMPLFWWHSSRANLDIPLAAFVTATLAAFWRCYGTRRSGTERIWGPDLWLQLVCVALAFLAKGLVGVVLPVLVVLVFLVLDRNLAFLRRIPWIASTLLLVLLVLPWLGPFALAERGAYLDSMFVKHHLQRYASGFDHQRPWMHYFKVFPTSTFPWVLALPLALWRAIRLPPRSEGGPDSILLFAWAWLLAPFVFFSLSASKRDLYLLPSFPALALLAAWTLGPAVDRGESASRPSRWMSLWPALGGLAMVLVPMAPLCFPNRITPAIRGWAATQSHLLHGLGALSMACGVMTMAAGWRRTASLPAIPLMVPGLALMITGLGWLLPAYDHLKSGRSLIQAAQGRDVVGYRLAEGDLGIWTFGLGRTFPVVREPAALTTALAGGRTVMAQTSVIEADWPGGVPGSRELARAPIGDSEFVVLTGAPGPLH